YRPLDSSRKEIRILYLEPEPLHSPKDVVVHVFNASLLEPNIPRLYGCLSYYWGDPKITKAIQVMYTEKSESENNGLLTTQTEFRVNANLEAALRVFRSKLNRPVMWADALCINQSDIDERSPQVGLMAEIYAQAVQTIVRLGDADGTTKTVFD
ncbi:HET-domain-containing protein, partial [Lojkania enalia]